MDHIKLFESFVSEEDSNIYGSGEMTSDSAASPKELELKKGVVKTWINDYVIPFMDYYAQDWNTVEKDPKFKTLVTNANNFLRKSTGGALNGNIIRGVFYLTREASTHPANRNDYPLRASFWKYLEDPEGNIK